MTGRRRGRRRRSARASESDCWHEDQHQKLQADGSDDEYTVSGLKAGGCPRRPASGSEQGVRGAGRVQNNTKTVSFFPGLGDFPEKKRVASGTHQTILGSLLQTVPRTMETAILPTMTHLLSSYARYYVFFFSPLFFSLSLFLSPPACSRTAMDCMVDPSFQSRGRFAIFLSRPSSATATLAPPCCTRPWLGQRLSGPS